MRLRVLHFQMAFASFLSLLWFLSLATLGWGQGAKPPNAPRNGGDFADNVQSGSKVPAGVILVKGAWSSASDSVTPVPEDGNVFNHVFSDPYFGLSYALPPNWEEKYKGPPPSESGRYVLAQLRPTDTFKGPARGSILITAQDMFFSPFPAANALELVNYSKNNLQADYKVEMQPTPTKIAGSFFTFFAYWSPVAELHWYVLATEMRCHAVEMVLASRDTKLLENLILDLDKMKLPVEASSTAGTDGGDVPVCIKDYASGDNVLTRLEPVFTEHRFNSVPVRIIIDREGKIKHIHFLSAFPDQAKAITDALEQWKFKPYRREGKPVEVETGIMFGRAQHVAARPAVGAPTD
jgi:hypothetical protein